MAVEKHHKSEVSSMKIRPFTSLLATSLALGLVGTAEAYQYSLKDVTVFTNDLLFYQKEEDTLVNAPIEDGIISLYNSDKRTIFHYDVEGNRLEDLAEGALPPSLDEPALLYQGYCFLDEDGKPYTDYYSFAYPYHEDYALVYQEDSGWSYIDREGNPALSHLQYDVYGFFYEGVALMGQKNASGEMEYGYAKPSGEVVIPFTLRYEEGMGGEDRELLRFSQGLAPYYDPETKLYGYQDMEGQVVIKPQYFYVFPFSEGLAYVKNQYFNGYIDQNGEEIIALSNNVYSGNSFQDGYAIIERRGTYAGHKYNTKLIAVVENPLTVEEDEDEIPKEVLQALVTPAETIQPTSPYVPLLPSQEQLELAPKEEVPAVVETAPTQSNILVNGKELALGGYSIDEFTYFSLADLAYALQGTASRFQITWDEEAFAIRLLLGKQHELTGKELSPAKSDLIGELFRSDVYLGEEKMELTAYEIDGTAYFQLNQLQDYLDLTLGWDPETSTITIDTRVLG